MEGYQAGIRYALAEPRRAPLGTVGTALSHATGSSLEFMEHREYQPGDDLRRIDWNTYARTDRLSVKLYREEVCPHVDLLLDGSRSMALAGTRKAEAALGLVGLLASAARESGFSFATYVTEQGCRRVDASTVLPTEWEPFDFEARVSPPEALLRLPPRWHRRAIRFFVSDLMFVADPLPLVTHLTTDAALTVVIQLLAQSDVDPPEHGNFRLVDSETGQRHEIYLDAVARRRYRENLARHQENYSIACRQRGAHFTTVVDEPFLENRLLDDLLAAEILQFK
jgi:uncharacterized protein (DUF58 family)